MGEYIYRATAKTIKLQDGTLVNTYKFAYKPYNGWSNSDLNSKMHFKSGCIASDNMTLKSNYLASIDEEKGTGTLFLNDREYRVFYDGVVGSVLMPKVADLYKEGKRWVMRSVGIQQGV